MAAQNPTPDRLFQPVDIIPGQMVLTASSERIPARQVRVGDWPISLAGWRPCSRVTRHRTGLVSIIVDGRRFKVDGSRLILVKLASHGR